MRDTGVGIDPSLLARLFDPFSQAEQGLARSTGGLGLGLALTKGLAELHGGGVRAVSEGPGQGACFELCVPLADATREDAASPRPSLAGGLRILSIEDNRDAAEMLGDVLTLAGHEVEEARRRSTEAGFDAHFAKPADMAALKETLAGWAT